MMLFDEVVKIAAREDANPDEGEEKYGDVKYADPKNKKYPLDTAEHIRAALSYWGMEKNRAKYSDKDQKTIGDRIEAAARKANIGKAFDPDQRRESRGRFARRSGVANSQIFDEKTEKSADEGDFSVNLEFEIRKTDDEKQIVYGFASVSKMAGVEMTDLQGDVVSTDEIQRAAHDFMIESRVGGDMHVSKSGGIIVESLIVDGATKKALGIARPEEGWFIGYKVTDGEVWKGVKEGKYKGFSIGGTGVRTPIAE